MGRQFLGLYEDKVHKNLKELEKKKELAQAAATAMDTSPDGETLAQTVEKAVAAALRQKNKPAGNKRGKGKEVRTTQCFYSPATNSSLGKRKEARYEEVLSGQPPEKIRWCKESHGLPERRQTKETRDANGIGSFYE